MIACVNKIVVLRVFACYLDTMNGFSFPLANELETNNLGAALSKFARIGDFFALYGDLGAGKTTFARGIIGALCHENEVPSPTFTILQTYESHEGAVWHFDLYRLKSPGEVYELGWEEIQNAICLVEWPQMAGALLPSNRIEIRLEFIAAGRIANISIFGNGDFTQYWQKCLESINND